jgi:hypothetical protein
MAGGARRDLVVREVVDRLAQGIDGVAEVEVQAGKARCGHGRCLL